MLLAASVSTTRKDLLMERWARERQMLGPHRVHDGALLEGDVVLRGVKDGYRLLGPGELGPAFTNERGDCGLFAVFDWSSGEVVWQQSWGSMLLTPFGFCFADGAMYLVDEWGCAVFLVDIFGHPGALLRRISHPYLSDVHSVYRSSRGLLITSSGTDAIIELDLEGNLLYEWWAAEHGYARSESGDIRTSGRGLEHRDKLYHSRYQTTHVNDALFRDPHERYLLALLQKQGQIIEIDRARPDAEQDPKVLVEGLVHPHGLRRTPYGWMVTSTESNEVLMLDDAFRFVDRIYYKSRWIHDALLLTSGDVVLNDPSRSVLVQFSGPPWRISRVVPYPVNWRLFRLLELTDGYENGFGIARPSVRGRPVSAGEAA
jgi:hypothetical protein